MTPESEWEWFGYAGHFIGGSQCAFHLTTKVGPWIVSTVGDYMPRGEGCEAMALGYPAETSMFETMVFVGQRDESCGCWTQADGSERDTERYATHEAAAAGHLRMCRKWAEIAGTA